MTGSRGAFDDLAGGDLLGFDFGDQPVIPADAVRPPMWILATAAVGVVVSFGLLVLSSRPAHGLGYGVGAIGVAIAIIAFRRLDRKRQLSTRYVGVSWASQAAVALIILGLVAGLLNAFQFFSRAVVA